MVGISLTGELSLRQALNNLSPVPWMVKNGAGVGTLVCLIPVPVLFRHLTETLW